MKPGLARVRRQLRVPNARIENAQCAQDPWTPDVIGAGAHWWLLDEGSGQAIADANGALDGQLGSTSGSDTNDPAWASEGLDFDGGDDYATLGNVLAWDRTQPRTMLAVVNFDTLGASSAHAVINKNKYTGPFTGYSLSVINRLLDAYIIYGNPYRVKEIRSTDTIPTGTWLSIASTYDGSVTAAGLKVWRDGAELAHTVIDDAVGGSTPDTDSTPLEFGARAGANQPTDGKLALVVMIPAEASEAQMVKLHNWARAIMAARSVTLPEAS